MPLFNGSLSNDFLFLPSFTATKTAVQTNDGDLVVISSEGSEMGTNSNSFSSKSNLWLELCH